MDADAAGVSARVRLVAERPVPSGRTLHRTMGLSARPIPILAGLLALVATGLFVLIPSERNDARQELALAADRLDLVAGLVAHEAQLLVGTAPPGREHVAALARGLPALALAGGRTAYLSDSNGTIVGSTDPVGRMPRTLSDLFGVQDPEMLGENGAVMAARLANGKAVLASVRSLSFGHLALVQPRDIVATGPAFPWMPPPLLALALATGLCGFWAGCLRYNQGAALARLDRTWLTQRLDTSLARGRCGVWDWDVERDSVFWSTSLYEILGYEARGEHLAAGEVAAILHPEDGGLDSLRRAVDPTGSGQVERDLRARTRTGDWRWLRIKAESVLDPVDGNRHLVGFASDVTEERGAAERRARDDMRLRDAVEAISEAFVLWDADERLILCNSKFLKLHGVPPELASPGTPAAAVLAAGRRPIVETQLSSTRPQQPGNRTLETQLSDGRWLHVNERRTRDGGVVSIGTDVSDLKRQEARLRDRERRLQGSVRAAETEAQRFADLAERHQEANLAKTEFLARMSHELRTPLNAIIGFSDVMRQEIFGPLGSRRYAEYTRDIHASGLQLLDVIDDVLQMSRLEKGQVTLAPELMLIETPLGDALGAVAAEAAERRVAIEADIVEPVLLQADRDALRDVFVRLLRNAVTFSPVGGIVRIKVRPADTRLNVYVEDGGAGIPTNHLRKLGRPFEQLESEDCRARGGSGLGLAISRALVEMHGGRLRLRSQPGVGTIALVHLPLVQPAANDASGDWPPRITLVAAE